MGLETASLVIAAVSTAASVASQVAKSNAQAQAAHASQIALDMQAKQLQLRTQQKTLSNYDVLKKVTDAQIAHQTVTGTAFSSPSFNAIQRHSLSTAAKNQRNIEIEGGLEQENIKIQKENVRNNLYAQLFGNAAETANTAFSVYSKIPKKAE
jgi:hypothetical protein